MRIKSAWLTAAAAVLLSGCVHEDMGAAAGAYADGEAALAFRATVVDGSELQTRADNNNADEQEHIWTNPPKDVTYEEFKRTRFYIYEEEQDADGNPTDWTQAIGTYWVGSGNQGQLDPVFEEFHADRLLWRKNNTPHRFWSWTWPMDDDDWEGSGSDDAQGGSEPGDGQTDAAAGYEPLNQSEIEEYIKLKYFDFQDSGLGDGEDGWNNGAVLERLVGATTDRAYTYIDDGKYVPLQFRHLVSKIVVGSFVLVDAQGATHNNLKGNITFMGLPKRAILYPRPEGNGFRPVVKIDEEHPYGETVTTKCPWIERKTNKDYEDANKEYLNHTLRFAIKNEGITQNGVETGYDTFYIAPEVDFDDVEFEVEFLQKVNDNWVPNTEYNSRGNYYGTFKSVTFRRVKDTDYDGEGGENVGTETSPKYSKVLHAGEVMVINMTIYEQGSPGMGVDIKDWNSERGKGVLHHIRPGIYSDAEARSLRDALSSNPTKEKLEEMGILYADKDEGVDDEYKDVFRMYHDVTLPEPKEFPIPDGYILDGMGFTLKFEDSAPDHQITIGNMRDIYITNGHYTIYIDADGNILWLDEKTGEYQETGGNVNAESTTIDLTNGTITSQTNKKGPAEPEPDEP